MATAPECLQGNRSFTLDPQRSRFAFRAKSFGLLWVTGTLRAREGRVEVREGAVSAEGVALAASVSTGIAVRDWHLRHAHYLRAAAHPEIRLSIPPTPVTATSTVATLTARGRSLEVQLELVELAVDVAGELRARLSGRIDRSPLGMLPPLAGVSRLVELDFDVVARPAPERAET
jgi:polyisoprenoid-binding protein YceI